MYVTAHNTGADYLRLFCRTSMKEIEEKLHSVRLFFLFLVLFFFFFFFFFFLSSFLRVSPFFLGVLNHQTQLCMKVVESNTTKTRQVLIRLTMTPRAVVHMWNLSNNADLQFLDVYASYAGCKEIVNHGSNLQYRYHIFF